ncbi:hypothetical protein A0J61_08009 [Choanephora cucurbitarum]|uniref:Uncharacterized protein n=1 Tax=Choanephora cucurbitarum TaxID=101091 RepID=A0A1C7N497_9FUNG|nr:hypothetical protein A0J61_08009 [Choanephora cucurbitarum]
MHKSLYSACFLYLALTVMGQQDAQSPLDIISSISAAIPTEIAGPLSAIVNSPFVISQASAQVTNLPPILQGVAYSILAQATETAPAQATETAGSGSSKPTEILKPSTSIVSSGSQFIHPMSMIIAL